MTSPVTCTCGVVHADGCPGMLTLCLVPGFVFDWTWKLTSRLTGYPQDWPVGTTSRMRFSWGTGTELIIPNEIDGPYIRVHMTSEETELVPRSAMVAIDLNFDSGDPELWRPWRAGRVSACH